MGTKTDQQSNKIKKPVQFFLPDPFLLLALPLLLSSLLLPLQILLSNSLLSLLISSQRLLECLLLLISDLSVQIPLIPLSPADNSNERLSI